MKEVKGLGRVTQVSQIEAESSERIYIRVGDWQRVVTASSDRANRKIGFKFKWVGGCSTIHAELCRYSC